MQAAHLAWVRAWAAPTHARAGLPVIHTRCWIPASLACGHRRVSWSIPPLFLCHSLDCHPERREGSLSSAAPKSQPGSIANDENARTKTKPHGAIIRALPQLRVNCVDIPQNRLTYATWQSSMYMVRVRRIRDSTDVRNVFPDRECIHGPDGPVAQAAGISRNRTAGRNERRAAR